MNLARILTLVALVYSIWGATAGPAQSASARLADKDIIDAYHYLLGRLLVLRQEHLDLKGTGRWLGQAHREDTWRNMASIAGFVFSVAILMAGWRRAKTRNISSAKP